MVFIRPQAMYIVQQKISHSVLNKQYYLTGFFHSTQIWGILFTTTARNSNVLDDCLMLFLLWNSLEKGKRHSTGKTLSTAWIIVIVNWIRSGYHHICRLSLREVNFHSLLPEYPPDGPLKLRKVRTSGETSELMSSKSFSVSEYLPPLSSSLA